MLAIRRMQTYMYDVLSKAKFYLQCRL